MSSSLKLKTSQQTKKQGPQPETSKIVNKEDQKKPSNDIEDLDDDINLVEVAKKPEKKQQAIQPQTNEVWQQQDDPKELPTNGIGKKQNASQKKPDEPVLEINKEEFPDLAAINEIPKKSKKQQNLQNTNKPEQKPQPNTNNAVQFINSNSKSQVQPTQNAQPKTNQLNSNSGPLTFTNTKKSENTVLFQQQQQEQIKKNQQESQVQPQPQIQETQKPNPPQRQINISRNSNTVSAQPVVEQQKQLKVEESIPTFINSKAKGNPPVAQQQQQQPQEQQQQQEQQPQQNEDEDSDGWETVEKKRKNKGGMQRNQKKNS